MSGHEGEFELGPDDEQALAELVGTLRDATPSPAQLAPARSSLVRAPRRGAPWLRLLLLALAIGVGASQGPAAREQQTSGEARARGAPGRAEANGEAEARPEVDAEAHAEASANASADATANANATASANANASASASANVGAIVTPTTSVGPTAEASAPLDPTADTLAVDTSSASKQATPTEPRTDEAPSPLFADALRQVGRGRCDEAAPRLARVVEGETLDSAVRVEEAELALAGCLFDLGYVHTSSAVADAISQRGPDHAGHVALLVLLARLAERLPDVRGVVGSVGRYAGSELELAPVERRGTLRYLLARARYDEGELEESATLFRAVPPGHRFHVEARYREGIAHVRRRRAQPAITAFEDVLASAGTSRDGASSERGRFRDLARLAIARVRYSAARPGREATDVARREALLRGALEAWQEIPFGSEAGLDAFFEESWALYLLGEDARALGHVHGLLAPQLRERPHPEALVLRATIYFENCRFDAAGATVADFHDRFDPLLAGLERVEAEIAEPAAAFRLLDDARSGRGPAGLLGEVVRAALDDREIARLLVSVRAIDAELARLAGAAPELRDGSLGLRIAQELALARSFAVETAARLVEERLARVTSELRDRTNDIDTVALEIDTQRRRALEQGTALTSEPERPVPIVAVQGDQIWPYDGEYWEDELPYYRELVTSLCAR